MHVFNLVEHGRYYLPRLVYSTHVRYCLSDLGYALIDGVTEANDNSYNGVSSRTAVAMHMPSLYTRSAGGNASAFDSSNQPSVVITRPWVREADEAYYHSLVEHIGASLVDTINDEKHIPPRFLSGVVPAALLERYDMWQLLIPGVAFSTVDPVRYMCGVMIGYAKEVKDNSARGTRLVVVLGKRHVC